MTSAPENMDTQAADVELLPKAGDSQFMLDWGYKTGQFLKANVVAVSIGFAAGVMICFILNNRKGNS